MIYQQHPSEELNSLYHQSDFPHQGQHPLSAKVIFIGLDANYSPELSVNRQFFDYILNYHEDGVGFWREHGIHHPFLHPLYPLSRRTGGVPYHRKFSKMGLDSSFADKISFIELLPIPTTGNTQDPAFWSLFNVGHATKIDSLVTNDDRKLVILSRSVMKKMRTAAQTYGVFEWLPEAFLLGEMTKVSNTIVFGALHFSAAVTNESLLKLGAEIRKFCYDSI